jgi:predicted glycoside hydrolase/deacetylase ChbG (UPF0249 family)
MRAFVLCADDYAMTEGISRAILELLALGRLSATSAMTNLRHWPAAAAPLQAHVGQADIGLHLSLTCGPPLGPMPTLAPDGALPSAAVLARRAMTGQLDRDELAREIGRQLDAFQSGMGRWPDHVDGHQHVHTLPVVRDALFAALLERGLAGKLWLRDPADAPWRLAARRALAAKATAVAAMAFDFGRSAAAQGFAVNEGFSGFSAFDPRRPYREEFLAALKAPGPRHLVMCHPGHVDEELPTLDSVVATREHELAYFTSAAFTADLQVTGCRLARFAEL